MEHAPLVISGIGGSGTRVLARIARAAGHFMGTELNRSEDALALYGFTDDWAPAIYDAWVSGAPTPDAPAMWDALDLAIRRHRGDCTGRWGWKQPRTMNWLPVAHRRFPDMRFVQVVRDGRDVAFGKASHLALSGYVVPDLAKEIPEVRLGVLWSRLNEVAADYAEAALGERFLVVRLEDLTAAPTATVERIMAFAGTPVERAESIAAELVDHPQTMGRWRNADPATAARVEQAIGRSLGRFGYEPGQAPTA